MLWGSRWSAADWPTICASTCAACRTSIGRCRGWGWIAAGRAIWRRCAAGWRRPPRLPNGWRVDLPAMLAEAVAELRGHDALLDLLDRALVAEPPLMVRDGGFIAPGHDADLDEARTLRDEGRGVIANMQGDYIKQTGIGSLKIKHNNVLGYFVEVTATHAEKMLARR